MTDKTLSQLTEAVLGELDPSDAVPAAVDAGALRRLPLSTLGTWLKTYFSFLTATDKGAANGVAGLDATGKVPTSQLPSSLGGSFLPTSDRGAANGVASLDATSKVPVAQLPTDSRYPLASEKAAANGIATLDATGKLTASQVPALGGDGTSIPLTQKGAANGVATLDGTSKVPTAQLPDYVLTSAKGAASGVASLDGSGLVPTAQLPTDSRYVATTTKGAANGVASLDATGKVPVGQIPTTGSGATVALDNTTLQAASGAQSLSLPTFFNREITALKFIPSGLHAAIFARTSTTNVAPYLQAALDELETRGGGLLLLEEGRYCVQTNLRIPSKVRIQGRGAGSTMIKALTSGWTNHASITGALTGSNLLLMNKNLMVSSLTDTDISLTGVTLDNTGNGGGAHCFMMRYVDRVSVTDCRFVGGSNGTAFLACRDTLVANCHAQDVTNCFYDHWDGAGYAKVIGCTGRGAPEQGIMFTATSTDYVTRTASNFIAIGNHIYGVKNVSNGNACGLLVNALSSGSRNYNAHFADNFVENCDIGIGFIGGGGNHTSTGDHIKDCSKVGVLVGDDGSGQCPKDVAIRSLMVTDCYATGGNPAVIAIGATSQRIHLRDITFGGSAVPAVHVWFAATTSGCTVDTISGIAASSTSVNNQAGAANTILAYGGGTQLVVAGSDGSGAYEDWDLGATSRIRMRDGSINMRGPVNFSDTVNIAGDTSLTTNKKLFFNGLTGNTYFTFDGFNVYLVKNGVNVGTW